MPGACKPHEFGTLYVNVQYLYNIYSYCLSDSHSFAHVLRSEVQNHFWTMQSVFHYISTYLLLFIVILGLTLNGFIVLMNGKTWIRNKCLPPGDKIVTSLCLSRWIYQCLLVMHQTFLLFLPGVHLGYTNNFFFPARGLLNYITIWFASLLCMYYCVKISNYKHVVFLYLKVKMSRLTPWCLGLCIFISSASILPYSWKYLFSHVTTDVFQNMTQKTIGGKYTYVTGSSPPLVIFTIAFFLTVPSLWRHIRNMSCVGTGFRNQDMQTHYNAIKSITAFFLLHMLFIVCVNINASGVLEIGSSYEPMMTAVSALYPCLHSGVIIFYNRKLRKGFLFPLTRVLSYVQKKAVTDLWALG